jgi:membrane-anchored glycerophosphoryl diester phosphodiesterase (GDPDase)
MPWRQAAVKALLVVVCILLTANILIYLDCRFVEARSVAECQQSSFYSVRHVIHSLFK